MSYLNHLKINNFQRFDTLELTLGPRVNVILGPSDSGKSSILRFFRWIALNKPDGKSYIRQGAEKAFGSLTVGKHKIKKSKGKKNLYYLDKKKFAAFGRGQVPDEIKQILKVDDLNFQSQTDSHFWFSLSSSEVSKKINDIVNLSLLDSSMAYLSSLQRSNKAEQRTTQLKIEQLVETVKDLQWVKEARIDFDKAKTQYQKLVDLQKSNADIDILWHNIDECTTIRDECKEKCKFLTKVYNKYNTLKKLEKSNKLIKKQQVSHKEIELVKKFDYPKLKKLYKKYKVKLDTNKSIKDLIKDIKDLKATSCKLVNSLNSYKSQLKMEKKSLKTCKACGQVIKDQ